MGILADADSKIIVQGITGREGSFHTKSMLEYGSRILAGVTPGKMGEKVHGVPVFDSVSGAKDKYPDANTSIVFVPARHAPDAVYEAIDAGINFIVVITEGIPVHDTAGFINYAIMKGVTVTGPNCPGIITPLKTKIGIMPSHIFDAGNIGVVSRSGTLTYEIADAIRRAGFGISTALGIGGDMITGLTFEDVLELFRRDKETQAIVIIGEIGGDLEERAASYIKRVNYEKPVVAYIAGRTAPPEKRMGHAGAVISMGAGDAESKIKALESVGVKVAEIPTEVPSLLMTVLRHQELE